MEKKLGPICYIFPITTGSGRQVRCMRRSLGCVSSKYASLTWFLNRFITSLPSFKVLAVEYQYLYCVQWYWGLLWVKDKMLNIFVGSWEVCGCLVVLTMFFSELSWAVKRFHTRTCRMQQTHNGSKCHETFSWPRNYKYTATELSVRGREESGRATKVICYCVIFIFITKA